MEPLCAFGDAAGVELELGVDGRVLSVHVYNVGDGTLTIDVRNVATGRGRTVAIPAGTDTTINVPAVWALYAGRVGLAELVDRFRFSATYG